MHCAKKSQMEIMGLAIIVILVALGLLFVLLWVAKTPPTKQVQRAKESVLAANFMNTMLGTTTGCNQRTVRELLQDCALTGGSTPCADRTSCAFAHEAIQHMLDETFLHWHLPYHLNMSGSSQLEQFDFGAPCTGEREEKIHPLPVRPGFEITLVMDICR
jgi:hypothetical protein